MALIQSELILWVGQKHSGKTTSVAKLAQRVQDEGFNVAGILAPSTYENGQLIGFDVLDLWNGTRVPLANRQANVNKSEAFVFTDAGLKLGKIALSPAATKAYNLVIIDEFGPLELHGNGWRKDVDLLLSSSNALLLLVVRRELADQVQQLYANIPSRKLNSTEPASIDKVIAILRNRHASESKS